MPSFKTQLKSKLKHLGLAALDLYKNGPVDSQVLDKGGARGPHSCLNFWL